MSNWTPIPPSGDDRFRLSVEGVKDYGIFMLDPHGIIVSWNAGAEHIKDYAAHEIIGHHFSQFYVPEAIERGWPEHELAMAANDGRFEDESWRLRKDGSKFWAEVVITAVRDSHGVLQGFSKVMRDLTERRRQEDALRESEEAFRLMVDGVRDYAMVMLDPQGRVRSWNSGAEQIIGYSAEEIVGRDFSCFYPVEAIERGWPAQQLAVAAIQDRFEEEGWRLRRDGSRFRASVVISALRNADGELRGFAKLTRDITDQKRLEALKQSTREMTEFLAMLSHELRNPLAPIRNAVEILGLTNNTDPAVVWSREVIGRQVTHLSRLVDDLLDVSRITSGKIALSLSPVDLRDAVRDAVESCRAQIELRGHTLKVNLPDEALRVNGDVTRLVQVITNLLSNATKYTPDGGTIGVSLAQHGPDAVLRVTDTGLGMRSELLDRAFELFAQGERSLARSEGGLGVGLTLVRRLVELHGGAVTAMSAGQDLGSTFEVRIPLTADTGSAPVRKAEPSTSAIASHRVLVVDDNADSCASMAALLELKGHDVRIALDGIAALETLRHFDADLVLLDIGLPGLSGYDVAEEIRRAPEWRHIVLCAMTGYGQDEDRRRARDTGFDHHLIKPVNMTALYAILDTLPRARQPEHA